MGYSSGPRSFLGLALGCVLQGSGPCSQASLTLLRPCLGSRALQRPRLTHPAACSSASLQEPRATHRADGATWRREGSSSPQKLHHPRARRKGLASGGPVQSGDVMTERRFSTPPPARLELPVPDVASPPSTLTLRAYLRAAEVAARAGRSSGLLILALLWRP